MKEYRSEIGKGENATGEWKARTERMIVERAEGKIEGKESGSGCGNGGNVTGG